MKKLFAVLIALVIVTTVITTTAFATDDVTVVNPTKTVNFVVTYSAQDDIDHDHKEVKVTWSSEHAGTFTYTKGTRSQTWDPSTMSWDDGDRIEPSGSITQSPDLTVTVQNLSSPGNDYTASLSVGTDQLSGLWSASASVGTPSAQAAAWNPTLPSALGTTGEQRSSSCPFDFSGLDADAIISSISNTLAGDANTAQVTFGFSATVIIQNAGN